jgi:hypothetical protein
VDGGRLLLAIGVAGGVLFVLELCRVFIQKRIAGKFDLEHAVEIQFLPSLLVNVVFVVMLPAVVYAALYPILPFTSYRSGFFIALFVFGVGLLPYHIRNYNQYKLPTVMTTFELAWSLLTLLVVIGCITYLYHY